MSVEMWHKEREVERESELLRLRVGEERERLRWGRAELRGQVREQRNTQFMREVTGNIQDEREFDESLKMLVERKVQAVKENVLRVKELERPITYLRQPARRRERGAPLAQEQLKRVFEYPQSGEPRSSFSRLDERSFARKEA
jgi:hypothetical protein